MPFKKGEHYRCPEPSRGPEIVVTRGVPATCGGVAEPICRCGRELEKTV